MNKLLNKLSIQTKIISNSLILLLLILGSSTFALLAMSGIGTELEDIAEQDIPMTKILTSITEHQLEQAVHFERVLRYGVLLKQEDNAAAHFKKEMALFNKLNKNIVNELHEGEALAKISIANAHSDAARKEFAHVLQSLKQIEQEHSGFEQHANQVFTLLTDGKLHEAEVIAEKVEQEEEQLYHELEALLIEIEKFTEASVHSALEHEQTALKTLAGFLVLALPNRLICWP